MSPSKRQRPTAGKGKGEGASAPSSGAAPRQRLGLLLFGVVFVVLFAGFAIAQGIGSPTIPEGDVVIVENVPSEFSTISKEDFDKTLLQAVAQGGLKKPPKPDSSKYEELKTTTLGSLLDAIWIQGEAEELGVTVTGKQIADEFKSIKAQNFKTKAEYEKFLKTSRLTQSDVNERVRLQLLSTEIQKFLGENPPKPSNDEVEDYYNAAKATQYTQKPTRDILVVIAKDKAKGEEAKALLDKDHSPASWKKVAKKYSTDPTSKAKGGLIEALPEETAPEPANAAIFDAPIGEVQGLVKTPNGYYLFEVKKSTPGKLQTLKEVQAAISSQLSQQAQQEAFSDFLAGYTSKWTSRTFCAADYTISRCANFTGNGHPESAPPACYEADPKGGIPADCPAPVQQLVPALPGSINILTPKGTPLPQRPQPAGLKPAGEEASIPGATTVPPPSE